LPTPPLPVKNKLWVGLSKNCMAKLLSNYIQKLTAIGITTASACIGYNG
jgi:hypothetical protein